MKVKTNSEMTYTLEPQFFSLRDQSIRLGCGKMGHFCTIIFK